MSVVQAAHVTEVLLATYRSASTGEVMKLPADLFAEEVQETHEHVGLTFGAGAAIADPSSPSPYPP